MNAPEGWTSATLGSECSIEIGGTPSRGVSAYWDTDGSTENAWVSIRDMHSRVINDTAERISDLGARQSNVKLQPKGTVLLSFKLTIGRVAFAGVPLYTNEAIAGLQSKALDSEYLYHGLQQWDLLQGVDQAIKGATLNKAKLRKISFSCPKSRAEQSKIAEVLSTVDRAIAQTEALIAKQQLIKTGLMQDLLTRGIDEHGQLRSEATHAFKDSPLGRIPVEWEVDVGSKYFSLHAGIPTSTLDWNPDGNTLYLKVDDFNATQNEDGIIWAENCFNCPANLQGRMLVAGTLVFPKRGAAIFLNRVEMLWKRATLDPNLMGLSVKRNVVAAFLQLVLLYRNLGTICDNSGIPQINNKHLYPLQFAMPSQREQEDIVRQARQTELGVLLTSERLCKLRHLKTALMQDLLTGKVRVTPLLQPAKEATA